MPIRQGFKNRQARNRHNLVWSKDDVWKDTKGGFNPDVFNDLDDVTRQRLRDHQVGPSLLKGDKHDRGIIGAFQVGQWGDGVHGEAGALNHMYWGGEGGSKRAHNRGNVQQAVWETGLSNIGDKDQLNQFLDRADSVKANNPDFLKDGWTPEAIMMMREQPQQEVVQESAPVVADPVEVAETPAVVEETPVVREPVKGVDYMSSDMQDAYDRIQNYNSGFSADKWIADTTKPDEQSQAHAQALADKYKFEIKEDLKPTEDSVLNALNAAIPAIGGLMT